jgi:hypothetical protein
MRRNKSKNKGEKKKIQPKKIFKNSKKIVRSETSESTVDQDELDSEKLAKKLKKLSKSKKKPKLERFYLFIRGM